MEHCTLGCPEHIQIGQIWKEVDPRFNRYVRVEALKDKKRVIDIRTVIKTANGWVPAPWSRLSSASRNRFSGKRNGYVLHAHPEQNDD